MITKAFALASLAYCGLAPIAVAGLAAYAARSGDWLIAVAAGLIALLLVPACAMLAFLARDILRRKA